MTNVDMFMVNNFTKPIMVKVKLLLLCLCHAAVWTWFARACCVGKCLINITRTKRRLLASMSEMKRFIARIMLQVISNYIYCFATSRIKLLRYEAICNLWLNRKNTNCLMRFNFVSLIINSISCCFEFRRQSNMFHIANKWCCTACHGMVDESWNESILGRDV